MSTEDLFKQPKLLPSFSSGDGEDLATGVRERSCDLQQEHMLFVLCGGHSVSRTGSEASSL